MANNIIIQFSEQEFKTLLKDCINESLKESPVSANVESEAIFNVKQASQFLDIAIQTLYGYTSNFTIPFFKKGKKLYFKKSDLIKWINDGKKL
ncbi:MAG: helix-turn-helix domain-containing protein [Chitinophagaceae bacterium]